MNRKNALTLSAEQLDVRWEEGHNSRVKIRSVRSNKGKTVVYDDPVNKEQVAMWCNKFSRIISNVV